MVSMASNTQSGTSSGRISSVGETVLKAAVRFWFGTAVFGQILFAVYILGFYGRTAVTGRLGEWNTVLYRGLMNGAPVGNVVLGLHLLLALVVIAGGPLQFIPSIRTRAPRFHRWVGRVYVVAGFAISLGGLFLVVSRGVFGGPIHGIAVSINALLVLICGSVAVRYAMARKFERHRQWAMRLYLAMSGVWFFRVGLMLWILVNQGPVGIGKDFQGPFAISWAFGGYLLPLTVHEMYLFAKTRPTARPVMAIMLFVLTIGMILGIGMATVGMWLPRLK